MPVIAVPQIYDQGCGSEFIFGGSGNQLFFKADPDPALKSSVVENDIKNLLKSK